jgi:hypothetical protein
MLSIISSVFLQVAFRLREEGRISPLYLRAMKSWVMPKITIQLIWSNEETGFCGIKSLCRTYDPSIH